MRRLAAAAARRSIAATAALLPLLAASAPGCTGDAPSVATPSSAPAGTAAGPGGGSPPSPDAALVEELTALGYAAYGDGPADRRRIGVTVHDADRAWDGVTLIDCALVEMDGTVVRRLATSDVCEPTGDGGLIVLDDGREIRALDAGGGVRWSAALAVHHDAAVTPDGHVLVAARTVERDADGPATFDVIVELSADGRELSRWSTFDHRAAIGAPPASPPAPPDARRGAADPPDRYHLNGVHVMGDTPLGRADPRFRQGNWLLSLNLTSQLLVVDQETREIVWSWGPGELEGVHSASLLDRGTILAFDNGWTDGRGWSRVVEIDPLRGDVVWQYAADPPGGFHSPTMGSAQRLPNGNTLICASHDGRVFEVTPDGTVVWERYEESFDHRGHRRTTYRALRLRRDAFPPRQGARLGQ